MNALDEQIAKLIAMAEPRRVPELRRSRYRSSLVPRLLRHLDYPQDVVTLITRLLHRFGEPAENDPLSAPVFNRLLTTIPADSDSFDVVSASRMFALGGRLPDRTVTDLLSVLGESATEPSDKAAEIVPRLLRRLDYPNEVVSLVSKLVHRFGAAAEGDPLSASVLNRLLSAVPVDGDSFDTSAAMRMFSVGGRLPERAVSSLLSILADNAKACADDPAMQAERLAHVSRVTRGDLRFDDALLTIAETDWMDEPAFATAYREARASSSWGRDLRWRVSTLVRLAANARRQKGDFVECGVDTGGTALAVMAYLGDATFAERRFFLFDTFEGLVGSQMTPDELEAGLGGEARYPPVLEKVRETFAGRPYARIVPGVVPETLAAYDGDQVAFLHIDMNVALPEVAAFEFFWPFLAPGAPVVFDDYGFPKHQAQRAALDAVAKRFEVEILMLPTCQGIVCKPS